MKGYAVQRDDGLFYHGERGWEREPVWTSEERWYTKEDAQMLFNGVSYDMGCFKLNAKIIEREVDEVEEEKDTKTWRDI